MCDLKSKRNRIVGILGGKGPEATSELFRLIIANTTVTVEEEHLRVIIDNNPQIPKPALFISGKGKNPIPALVETAKNLERSGAEFIAIPCNSAHYFISDIRREINIKVLDIIDETVLEVKSSGCRSITLLGTSGLIESGIYQKKFTKVGVDVIEPNGDEQEKLWQGTLLFKDKKEKTLLRDAVLNITSKFKKVDKVGLVLGCTDIPPALKGLNFSMPVFDSLEILAKAIIREATKADIL